MIGVRKIFWNPTLNFIGFNLLNVGRILSNTERRPSNYSDTKKNWFRLVFQVLINMSRIHKINRFSLILRNIRSLRLPKIKKFRTEFCHRLQTIHIFLNAKTKIYLSSQSHQWKALQKFERQYFRLLSINRDFICDRNWIWCIISRYFELIWIWIWILFSFLCL